MARIAGISTNCEVFFQMKGFSPGCVGSPTVTQVCIGRFHHFHLARALEARGLLREIWTGYPRFKLKNEAGIPPHRIRSFPWIQTPYLARNKLRLGRFKGFSREWSWWAHETLDLRAAAALQEAGVVIALSGSGLHAGRKMQRIGGRFVCDRGSTHKVVQNKTLHEEYARWGLTFEGIDPRSIDKEKQEYETADVITVPSEFVRRTFLAQGISPEKVVKIPYGANLNRFKKLGDPDNTHFRVLWVGAASIRKGFLDAVRGFGLLNHPNKEFVVIGSVAEEIRQLLKPLALDGIRFLGQIPNQDLARHFSEAHAFVLTSLEEGLALVQAEALACGCPIIATPNTGCEDLIDDGVEGFVIPPHSPDELADRLQRLADDREVRIRMSEAALARIQRVGGWKTYGDAFASLVDSLTTRNFPPSGELTE